MCQLLGISSNREVDITFAFREWRHRGRRNPHGYGFAYWCKGHLQVVKAASDLYSSDMADRIAAIRSDMFVCHVRFATVGANDGTNTHPFTASAGGRDLAFAHNGTVSNIKKYHLAQRHPKGETDSEHAFLWLLEQVGSPGKEGFAREIKGVADEIRKLGRFNFLMSDGEILWAYADNSLYFIERRPPYGGELVRLEEDGYTISLNEVKRRDERAVLVATLPLTDERGWSRLGSGELLVVRAGRVEERIL